MSFILDMHVRPTVFFDANNKDHRREYANFLKYRGWSRCPVQFYLDSDYPDVLTMVQTKLAAYYTESEFRSEISRVRRKNPVAASG
jgi:hypothetical protein